MRSTWVYDVTPEAPVVAGLSSTVIWWYHCASARITSCERVGGRDRSRRVGGARRMAAYCEGITSDLRM